MAKGHKDLFYNFVLKAAVICALGFSVLSLPFYLALLPFLGVLALAHVLKWGHRVMTAFSVALAVSALKSFFGWDETLLIFAYIFVLCWSLWPEATLIDQKK